MENIQQNFQFIESLVLLVVLPGCLLGTFKDFLGWFECITWLRIMIRILESVPSSPKLDQ